MKKIFLLFVILSLNIFAQEIGVVDSEYVITHYKKREILEGLLNTKKDELNKAFDTKRQKAIAFEKILREKGDKVTPEEIQSFEKLQKELEETAASNEQTLGALFQKYFDELRGDISVGAILVGKEKKLNMVIHKSTTFYGGVDITEEVLNFLNSADKIDVKKEGIKINNDLKKI